MRWPTSRPDKRRQSGQQAEQLARQWLQQQGLKHCQSNWQCRLGEIDLIMQDDDCWVFVEVRYRRSRSHGGALASVTASKQRKLIAAAGLWLGQQSAPNACCRFDVLGLEPDEHGKIQFQWVPHAFMGESQ